MYDVDVRANENHVAVSHTGKVSLAELEEARSAAAAALTAAGLRNLLVDLRQAVDSLDDMDHYEFTSGHRKVLPPGCVIALLVKDHFYIKALFIEDISNNRGVPLRVFTQEAVALEWLGDHHGDG